jgi:hypothetical protein
VLPDARCFKSCNWKYMFTISFQSIIQVNYELKLSNDDVTMMRKSSCYQKANLQESLDKNYLLSSS